MGIGMVQDFIFVSRIYGDKNVLLRGTFGSNLDPGFAGFYSESNVRVEKASRSLRRFLGFPFVACAKDLLASLVFPSSFSFFFPLGLS